MTRTDNQGGDSASDASAAAAPLVRTAARIILADPDDRVLLLAARDPADDRLIWFVPGGGLEPGETLEQAAVRELAEEVPFASMVALRGPVWRRRHDFSWAGRPISQTEWFFFGRLDRAFDVTAFEMSGEEARFFAGARWASLDELVEFDDIVAPRRIAELLRPLLAGEFPSAPIEAGV